MKGDTIKYATRIGANNWDISTITIERNESPWVPLDISSQGIPHICYLVKTGSWSYLKHAYKTGATWIIEKVDSVQASGDVMDIKLGPSSDIHILWLYTPGAGEIIKYAKYNGTQWEFDSVWADVAYVSLSIALDQSQNPHIVRTSVEGGSSILIHIYKSGGTWYFDTIDVAIGGAAQFPDIEWGPSGISVVYRDSISSSYYLKFYTQPGTEIIENNIVCYYPDLDFDNSGVPHVSYDNSGVGLKYAYKTNAWQIESLTTGPAAWSRLDVDNSGQPHICFTVLGDTVKYAYKSGGGPNPDIWVSPDPFNQTMEINSQIDDELTIGNNGSENLVINSMVEDPEVPWLSFIPWTGSIPPDNQIEVTLTFNSYGLAPGTYQTTIKIYSNDPNENPYILPVNLTVTTTSVPNFAWLPKSISVTLPQNGSTIRTLYISNTETTNSVLEFAISESNGATWVDENPISGNVNAGDTQNVSLIFNSTELAPGNYSTILKIFNNDPDYVNNTPCVAVNLTVTAVSIPVANISPTKFEVSINKNQIQTRELKIKNDGNDTLTWNLEETADWLNVSQTSGNILPGGQDIITLTFDSHNQNAGFYSTYLIITTNEPPNPKTYQVPVIIQVLESNEAYIEVEPQSISHYLQQGSIGYKNLWIKNNGNKTLTWNLTIKNNSSWLNSTNPR
jgi:hypothetical protein